MDLDEINKLHAIGAIKRGDYTLKSGQKTDVYFDLRLASSDPILLNSLSKKLGNLITKKLKELIDQQKIKNTKNIVIAGIPFAGVPWGVMTSFYTKLPLITLRTDAKNHGTKKMIEGNYDELTKVILIDDVFTTGISIQNTEILLCKNNLNVLFSVVLLNRSNFNHLNDVLSLTTMEELLNPYKIVKSNYEKRCCEITDIRGIKLLELVIEKKSNICVAMDYSSIDQILSVFPKIAPYVVMIKIHVDTIADCTIEKLLILKQLANNFKVLICEDRKLCDIGFTNLRYFERWHIPKWCDYITCLPNCGESSLKSLGIFCGLIIVSSMSSNPDPQYQKLGEEMATQIGAIGIVSQDGGFKKPYLVFVPGVSLDKTSDMSGQKYQTPDVKLMSGADILIIGRSICESSDPEREAKKYRDVCWNTYAKLINDEVDKSMNDRVRLI
jgi:uridine monophosphate synthetase